MSLFDIHKKQEPKAAVKTAALGVEFGGELKLINEKAKQELKNAIGDIAMGKHTMFFTKNSWTVVDLVLHILNQTGKANVYAATWAMKDFPARKLIAAKEMGLIDELHLKLDHRNETLNNDVFHFLKKNADSVVLAHCHAKLTVIKNEKWSVCICGSANYSANPRAEAGVVICDKECADKSVEWIKGI
jgi:hypothetical protein